MIASVGVRKPLSAAAHPARAAASVSSNGARLHPGPRVHRQLPRPPAAGAEAAQDAAAQVAEAGRAAAEAAASTTDPVITAFFTLAVGALGIVTLGVSTPRSPTACRARAPPAAAASQPGL
jgi:hypothetical protein